MRARLGQHFLVSEEVRDAIVAAAAIAPSDRVVEIGPGRGMLTRALLSRAAEVVAVEMDERLAEGLEREFAGERRLKVIGRDFLKLGLDELGEGPFKFVANLPYAVATPMLQRILPWPRWTSAVLMFQKEVAERITAGSGSSRYGLLTLSVLLHARAETVLEVPRECFRPRPKVSSAVLRFLRRSEPLLSGARQDSFFRVARAAFGQRRKMAAGLIARALGIPRARAAEALIRCGAQPSWRAEEIPLEAYLRLPSELGL